MQVVGGGHKGRDGTPGAVSRVLAKLQLANHCEALVAELPDGTKVKNDLDRIMDPFCSYGHYELAFDPSLVRNNQLAAIDPSLYDPQFDPQYDPFVQRDSKFCKTGSSVHSFLYDLFVGVYDNDLDKLVKKHYHGRHWCCTGALVGFGRQSGPCFAGRCAQCWSPQCFDA